MKKKTGDKNRIQRPKAKLVRLVGLSMVFVPLSKVLLRSLASLNGYNVFFSEHVAETTFCWPGSMSLKQEFRFEIGEFELLTLQQSRGNYRQ